jgi:hypothetical protein
MSSMRTALKLPDARGTLQFKGPVAVRWSASRPEGVTIAFGFLALRHHHGNHYVWTSARSREYLMTLDKTERRADRQLRTKELRGRLLKQ